MGLVNAIVYRSQRLDNLNKTLNITVRFDKDWNPKAQNVPFVLKSSINQIVHCAQNLNILEISDETLFRLCLNFKVEFKFVNEMKLLLVSAERVIRLVEEQTVAISGEILKRLVSVTRRRNGFIG